MCGILAVLNASESHKTLRDKIISRVKRIRHRGPDWSGVFSDDRAILAHERLSIVDVSGGAQPLIDDDTGRVLAVNGEIYNHKDLRAALKKDHTFKTKSDCEVILHLFTEESFVFLNRLNGIFAFVLYDPKDHSYFIARDHMGIIPLYWGKDTLGQIFVASELKAIIDICEHVEEFPPGHYFKSGYDIPKRYYAPDWFDTARLPTDAYDPAILRSALEAAVRRQLMCDVPYGLLISGGLDSSVIGAIAAKFSKGRVEENGVEPAWWPQIHSFAVGLKESPDLVMARKVADHIGSIHHEVHFTVQDGLDALSDVIYHLETFDVTTIRASTPMYLMSRKIKAMGIKMVLSGEGSDEIFGGYLYFHKAPNAQEFHEETVRKLRSLHQFDCLRANKSTAAWGVEARVPFLDPEFLQVAMRINPQEKMITKDRMEKWILRKAFEAELPPEVVWRQKEQFSDGVGYSWIDSLKAEANHLISDKDFAAAQVRFPEKTPLSKEAFLYRQIFESHFPQSSARACVPDGPSIACSSPAAIRWDASFANAADPSGRAVKGVHQNSNQS
jgi:asparagine synthase (glutamine-hydrolysing)